MGVTVFPTCRKCRGRGTLDNNGDPYDYEEWPCPVCEGSGFMEPTVAAWRDWAHFDGPAVQGSPRPIIMSLFREVEDLRERLRKLERKGT